MISAGDVQGDQRQPGDQRVGDRVGDGLRGELPVEPAGDAELGKLGRETPEQPE